MISTAEHVIVLTQQLCHSLAFLVAHAAATGCLVQLFYVRRDSPLPSWRALSGTLRRISQRRYHVLFPDGVETAQHGPCR